jgi:hypothetical protein
MLHATITNFRRSSVTANYFLSLSGRIEVRAMSMVACGLTLTLPSLSEGEGHTILGAYLAQPIELLAASSSLSQKS